MDPDPDPAIFVIDFQDANKKLIKKSVAAYYFLKIHIIFQRWKIEKKSQNSGFGSGGPKNMWIRWIRIRNTACDVRKNKRPVLYIGLVLKLKTWAMWILVFLQKTLLKADARFYVPVVAEEEEGDVEDPQQDVHQQVLGRGLQQRHSLWITRHQCKR